MEKETNNREAVKAKAGEATRPKVYRGAGGKTYGDLKQDPDWVWHLRAVVRKNPAKGKKAFDVRVFDEAQVVQKKVKIKDWTTFDEHPDLILYEGWFDKESMRAELEEKKTA